MLAVWDPKSDLQNGQDAEFFLIVGRRASGRTTLMLDLLACKQDVKTGVAFTYCECQRLRTIFGDARYHSGREVQLEALQALLALQQSRNKPSLGGPPPAVLVLDDCVLSSAAMMALKGVVQACQAHRVSIIMTIQCLKTMPPCMRDMATHIFTMQPGETGQRYPATVCKRDVSEPMIYQASSPFDPEEAVQRIDEPTGWHLKPFDGLRALRQQLTAVKAMCDTSLNMLPVC